MGGAHRVAHSCRGRGLLIVATLSALKIVPSLCFVARPSTRSRAIILKASVSTREAKQPHPLNNPGSNFFVDFTCIDCDTCRWMAPATFTRKGEQSVAGEPPAGDAELRSAIQAMISCPTGSIRTHRTESMVKDVINDFPLPIDPVGLPDVYHIGWHSALTFGAAPYLIVRPEGNVMVDVPKYNGKLADKIETLGGVKYHFLSHRDDVGGLEKWKERFPEITRVIHETEVDERTKDVEVQLSGSGPWFIEEQPDLQVLFVPGHTEGCCALLYSVEAQLPALFSGDHIAWSGGLQRLTGHPAYNWYDRRLQAESIRKLKGVAFDWLLPGHGRRYLFDQGDNKRREMLEVAALDVERYTGHPYVFCVDLPITASFKCANSPKRSAPGKSMSKRKTGALRFKDSLLCVILSGVYVRAVEPRASSLYNMFTLLRHMTTHKDLPELCVYLITRPAVTHMASMLSCLDTVTSVAIVLKTHRSSATVFASAGDTLLKQFTTPR